MHMDPNIGKRLSALGNTLTSLTGEEDIDDIADLNSESMADLSDEDEGDDMSPTIHMVSASVLQEQHRFWWMSVVFGSFDALMPIALLTLWLQ